MFQSGLRAKEFLEKVLKQPRERKKINEQFRILKREERFPDSWGIFLMLEQITKENFDWDESNIKIIWQFISASL